MPLKPQTGASVLVYKDGKVLLIQRGKEPYKGHWSLPGGSQETGETIEEAASRELEEETTLKAEAMDFVRLRDRISKDEQGSVTFHYVLATFFTQSFSGTAKAMDDADDIGWFTIEEMENLTTTPQTPQFVQEILNEKLKP
jgi:ADP-ribose pyrophosphatase YjhB (NUDIX family)